MDIFQREPGSSYVPAFAARLLLSMAKGLARAEGESRRALIDEDADSMWTLAMIVVQWYADALPPAEARVVAATLQEFEMSAIVANLSLFRERLTPFVKAAHQAQSDAQLAAAGVYFVAAVEQIGVTMLSSAIKSGPVAAMKVKVKARLQLPAEIRADYYKGLGGQPSDVKPTSATAPASRADRFDRADFGTRPLRNAAQAAPRSVRGQVVQAATRLPDSSRTESAETPPRPPDPNLASTEVARAYLHTLGWDGSEVDRLLTGPDGKRRA